MAFFAGLGAVAVPATAVGCAFCQFAFEQWAQSQNGFFVAHGTLTNGIFGLFVLIAIVAKAVRFDLRLQSFPAVGWAVIALFVYALISVIWSVSVSDSLEVWTAESPYVLLFVFACPLAVTSSRDWNAVIMAILTLGSFTSCLLLATSSFNGRQIVLQGLAFTAGIKQAGGNPLAIASMAGWVCLIGILMNFRGVARFWQVLRWVVVGVALILTIRSGSRGQMFALLAAAVVFLPVSRRIKSIPGFIGAVIGASVLLMLAYWAYDQYADVKRWDVDRMVMEYQSGRLSNTWTLIEAWLSGGVGRWLLGLGNSAAYAPFLLGIYPHFVPGEILAEEGLIGFALYVLILVLAFRCFRRAYAMVWQEPGERGRLAVLGAMCVFELILSMKQGSLLGNTGFFTLVILLGRYEAALREEFATDVMCDDAHQLERQWDPAELDRTGLAV